MAAEHLDLLRAMKAKEPFAPFRIVTASGEKLLVERRFQFAIGKTKVMYVFPDSDRLVQLSMDQISELEPAEHKPAA